MTQYTTYPNIAQADKTTAYRTNKHKIQRDRRRVDNREHHRVTRAKGKARAEAEHNTEKAAILDRLAVYSIKGSHGVVCPQVRELICQLVELGVPQTKTFQVIDAVLNNGGVNIDGKFDVHTARRVLAEGLVHSEYQAVDAILRAPSLCIPQYTRVLR